MNVASESCGNKLPSSQPYHSVEMNTDGNKCNQKVDVCNRNKNTVLIQSSITDEGVLSEGVMSGNGLCLEGIMYGGGLSGGGFVCTPCCIHASIKTSNNGQPSVVIVVVWL